MAFFEKCSVCAVKIIPLQALLHDSEDGGVMVYLVSDRRKDLDSRLTNQDLNPGCDATVAEAQTLALQSF